MNLLIALTFRPCKRLLECEPHHPTVSRGETIGRRCALQLRSSVRKNQRSNGTELLALQCLRPTRVRHCQGSKELDLLELTHGVLRVLPLCWVKCHGRVCFPARKCWLQYYEVMRRKNVQTLTMSHEIAQQQIGGTPFLTNTHTHTCCLWDSGM